MDLKSLISSFQLVEANPGDSQLWQRTTNLKSQDPTLKVFLSIGESNHRASPKPEFQIVQKVDGTSMYVNDMPLDDHLTFSLRRSGSTDIHYLFTTCCVYRQHEHLRHLRVIHYGSIRVRCECSRQPLKDVHSRFHKGIDIDWEVRTPFPDTMRDLRLNKLSILELTIVVEDLRTLKIMLHSWQP